MMTAKKSSSRQGANCEKIDVVIHNAGGMGRKSMEIQSFESVTSELMLNTVNLNGDGPLRVQQALQSKGYMGTGDRC